MLHVTFYRDGQGRCSGLSARGHTSFAEHGEDIVCAAVSAVLQAAALGLAEHAGAELESRQAPGELELHLKAAERDRESVRAIVATAELAVAEIARRFPDHVRLRRSRSRVAGGRRPERVTKPASRRRAHDV